MPAENPQTLTDHGRACHHDPDVTTAGPVVCHFWENAGNHRRPAAGEPFQPKVLQFVMSPKPFSGNPRPETLSPNETRSLQLQFPSFNAKARRSLDATEPQAKSL